jgi:hypothetical protein
MDWIKHLFKNCKHTALGICFVILMVLFHLSAEIKMLPRLDSWMGKPCLGEIKFPQIGAQVHCSLDPAMVNTVEQPCFKNMVRV